MTEAALDIRYGFPFWLRPFIRNGVAGITIGGRVYLDPAVADMPVDRIVSIVRHEVVHVNQYQRHGLVRFLLRYGFEYLRNRLRGLRGYEAYREISFEKEAFAEELMPERTENA